MIKNIKKRMQTGSERSDKGAVKWHCRRSSAARGDKPTGRLARWALTMQQWNFKIEHRRDAIHYVPDALSRINESTEREAAAFESIKDPWYLRMLEDVEK